MNYQKQSEKNLAIKKTYWFYLVGFFLILFFPLLSLPPWFSPPSWGKTIFFRIILSILIFFFLWQIFYKKTFISQPRLKLRITEWLLISLLGIFFLATLLSKELHFSFWGSPYRSGGFLNFAFFIFFAFLIFLILKPGDWKKIWDFSFIVAILVSLIGIFQKYELFTRFLIPYSFRPASTIGGPIFLAIYLLLLTYLVLTFAIKTKGLKRYFYFSVFLLFLFVIFLSGTRAAYFGGFLGFFYFLFFYPARQSNEGKIKKTIWLKVLAGALLILTVSIVWWLNIQPEIPQFIEKNKILSVPAHLLIIGENFLDARWPGWKISSKGLEDRPIFGYGPENFSIPFDKYYDPSLPYITQTIAGAGTGWWDRAHNFLLEIPLTAGIPALIIYLSFFGVLFWQLQKIKKGCPEKSLIYHGIQATFIAYLGANIFSFDTFSTYLISFLIIGYSFFLLREKKNNGNELKTAENRNQEGPKENLWYKPLLLFVLFCLLVWFVWVFNLKPFSVNSQINMVENLAKQGGCPEAIPRMEEISKSHSIVDHYLRLKYVDLIGFCIDAKNPVQSFQLGQRAYQLLKENIEMMPTYTRNWILLGIYANFLAEKEEDKNPERSKELLVEADEAFETAYNLSPKRQEVFLEWIKTDLLSGKYQEAKEKGQTCIEINREFKDCYWMLAIANLYLAEKEEAEKNIKIAKKRDYPVDSELSLLQQAKAYIHIKDYYALIEIYKKLLGPGLYNPQYHVSIAICYREVGDYDNARKWALKLLELVPSSKAEVEAFLKTLH